MSIFILGTWFSIFRGIYPRQKSPCPINEWTLALCSSDLWHFSGTQTSNHSTIPAATTLLWSTSTVPSSYHTCTDSWHICSSYITPLFMKSYHVLPKFKPSNYFLFQIVFVPIPPNIAHIDMGFPSVYLCIIMRLWSMCKILPDNWWYSPLAATWHLPDSANFLYISLFRFLAWFYSTNPLPKTSS